mmetsp:Transcript_13554/g.31885  ORF Transcript_13554/g.31885 Transcript_13554/m.31885 type:complete len:202 (-) Transcript_13554:753-1358(-)
MSAAPTFQSRASARRASRTLRSSSRARLSSPRAANHFSLETTFGGRALVFLEPRDSRCGSFCASQRSASSSSTSSSAPTAGTTGSGSSTLSLGSWLKQASAWLTKVLSCVSAASSSASAEARSFSSTFLKYRSSASLKGLSSKRSKVLATLAGSNQPSADAETGLAGAGSSFRRLNKSAAKLGDTNSRSCKSWMTWGGSKV